MDAAELLKQVTIPTPCPADWNAMSGDDRSRFCSQCEKSVYNLSAMSSGEAVRLIREREGRICARFFRRPDGTVVTTDCGQEFAVASMFDNGAKASRRRPLQFSLASVLTLMLIVSTSLAAIRLIPASWVARMEGWFSTPAALSQPRPRRVLAPAHVEELGGEIDFDALEAFMQNSASSDQ